MANSRTSYAISRRGLTALLPADTHTSISATGWLVPVKDSRLSAAILGMLLIQSPEIYWLIRLSEMSFEFGPKKYRFGQY